MSDWENLQLHLREENRAALAAAEPWQPAACAIGSPGEVILLGDRLIEQCDTAGGPDGIGQGLQLLRGTITKKPTRWSVHLELDVPGSSRKQKKAVSRQLMDLLPGCKVRWIHGTDGRWPLVG